MVMVGSYDYRLVALSVLISVPVMLLFVVLFMSSVNRVKRQRALLNELFEQAPESVALMSVGNQVIRVNREFTKVFGHTPREAVGRILDDLIVPDESRDEAQIYAKTVARGRRVDAEGVRRRKDGSRLYVSIVGVPVSLPGGHSAVYAIYRDITERKRAEERLREMTEQLRALSASLQSAREEEGIRIAREIHDELGSALAGLRWELESLDKAVSESGERSQLGALREKIETMIALTDTTVAAVRRISSELRPSILDDLGLAEAIEWQAQQFQARTGIVCRCECQVENLELDQQKSTAVFRIFQESLTNILRHAQATSVEIRMEEGAGELVLTVRDDGRGITEEEKTGRQALGLL